MSGRDLLTVPNLLCVFRLLGSPVLVILAWLGMGYWCVGLFVALVLSDWLDGKLAKLLKQETTFGARLDSFADVTFYACVLLAVLGFNRDLVLQEAIWIGAAVASYCLSAAAGWIKFGRVPTYHTWLAKTSWLLIAVGIGAAFADWSLWPLRIALAAVLVTNLEATAITFALPQWRVNVLSLFHALQVRKELAATSAREERL